MSNEDGFVVLAVVQRAHGLKGELKVELCCSGVDRLLACPDLLLTEAGKAPRPVKATKGFMRPDGTAVVLLREVEGRDEAQRLRGAVLAVPAAGSVPAPPGSFYTHDLIGCRVETPAGEPLGTLADVIETPANWVYRVQDGTREILLPAVSSMVLKVDLKARRIVADWRGETDADQAD